MLNATGGDSSAGIGGGAYSSNNAGGNITINGGIITGTIGNGASTNSLGARSVKISGGSAKGTINFQPRNESGNVYLTTLTVSGVNSAAIAAAVISTTHYGVNDVKTDTNGKLYFYLPANSNTDVAVASSGTRYGNNSVNVSTDNNTTATLTSGGDATLYPVTYSDGGAESGSVPATVSYLSGAQVRVLGNTGNLTKTDCGFGAWTGDNSIGVKQPGEIFTMPTAAVTPAPAWHKVTVAGAQTGTLTYGTGSSATYSVATENIADGNYNNVTLGGISYATASSFISNNTGTLTITNNRYGYYYSPAGTHSNVTARIGDATSAAFTLTINQGLFPAEPYIYSVTSPVAGATPLTDIYVYDSNWESFSSALTWDGSPAQFGYNTAYTATITIEAGSNYTLAGGFNSSVDIADFTVNGNAPSEWVSNDSTTLVFKVTFPKTSGEFEVTKISGDDYDYTGGVLMLYDGTYEIRLKDGAAIGGGWRGSGGTITINGGIINAHSFSNWGGAGIGTGADSTTGVGIIVINGGTIYATTSGNTGGAGTNGKDIGFGGGSINVGSRGISPTPTDGMYNVYLNKLYKTPELNNAAITDIYGVSYGVNDMKSDASGYLYFWLPVSPTSELIAVGKDGTNFYGADYTRAADNNNVQELNIPQTAAPSGLAGVAETVTGLNNGQITGTNITMEYASTTAPIVWADCTASPTTGLAAGTYYVRYKAVSGTSFASAAATVTIAGGDAVSYTTAVSPNSNPFTTAITYGYGIQTAQTFTITNNGNSAVTNVTANITGAGATAFAISTPLSDTTISSSGGNLAVNMFPARYVFALGAMLTMPRAVESYNKLNSV